MSGFLGSIMSGYSKPLIISGFSKPLTLSLSKGEICGFLNTQPVYSNRHLSTPLFSDMTNPLFVVRWQKPHPALGNRRKTLI
jgi:hypothetical protein